MIVDSPLVEDLTELLKVQLACGGAVEGFVVDEVGDA